MPPGARRAPASELVLVVDDDAMTRDLMGFTLQDAGYSVLAAADGAEALRILAARPDVAIVVSDMNMPVMDGLALLQAVRSRGLGLPVIVLTANDAVETAVQAIHRGAADYLLKDANIAETLPISVARVAEKSAIERQNAALLAELGRTVARLHAIVDNLGEGLLVTDASGEVVLENAALKRLLADGGRDEVLGLARRDPGPEGAEAELDLGKGRSGRATASPVHRAGESEGLGAVVLVRDTTAAKEVDRMKTEFISVASHELRTPLTSVLGFTKLALSNLTRHVAPAVPESDGRAVKALATAAKNLEIVIEEGDRMLNLIHAMLDIAKLESGAIDWVVAPATAGELVQRAVNATASLFVDRPIEVVTSVPDDLPELVVERDRVLQVLVNLLSNAAKFTRAGRVTLSAARRDGAIEFAVADSGAGIPADALERVFAKYQQVRAAQEGVPRGTGLGLPICRQIVEHHGGRIWVESAEGQGSTFRFTLPIR